LERGGPTTQPQFSRMNCEVFKANIPVSHVNLSASAGSALSYASWRNKDAKN